MRSIQSFQIAGLLLLGCVWLSGCAHLANQWSEEVTEPSTSAAFARAPGAKESEFIEAWWELFRDPFLTELVIRVGRENPDALAALARVDQAYASLGVTRAQLFPRFTGEGVANVQQDSLNAFRFPIPSARFESYRAAVNAQWELDLWGRIRGSFQRDQKLAEATAEDFEDVILSLQTTVARQVLTLRFVHKDQAILRQAVKVRKDAFDLQSSRLREGAGLALDVARAETEWEATRSSSVALERDAGKLKHALAVLVGEEPAKFSTKFSQSAVHLPSIPAGIPSQLLDRRPDLRAAEARLMAAAKQVGISKVDFLPRVTLTGSGGVTSLATQTLFTSADSFFYQLVPSVELPLWQGGSLRAGLRDSKAKFVEAVELYRSALLTAVQEVEDTLLDLQVLRKQLQFQRSAVAASEEALRFSQARYDQGLVSYFEVVDAQRSLLEAQRVQVSLEREQATATVELIQALGGGWQKKA